MRHLKNQRGFTLMELMVVIVIVAILAAVAVPLYINYVKDATRTEAKGAIGAIITAEQTHFQKTGTYLSVPVGGFVANPTAETQELNCDLSEALHKWDFSVEANGAAGFTAIASGKGDAAGLYVSYAYTRTGGGTWTETDPGGGGGPGAH